MSRAATTPATVLDPVHAAWHAVGRPLPAAASDDGPCARCADPRPLTPTALVVSRGFTSMDSWSAPCSLGLCPACTWAYRHPELRQLPHLVSATPPGLTPLTGPALLEVLATPPTPRTAITVPSRPGRKHVLPAATWGRVTLDETPLTWTRADTRRLKTVLELITAGAPAGSLTEPVPPWPVVAATRPPDRGRLLDQWAALRPWRPATPWLTVALVATRGRNSP